MTATRTRRPFVNASDALGDHGPCSRPRSGEVSTAEIERRLAQVARIVVEFGGEYVPIFERLEAEIAMRRKAEDAVTRAKALVRHRPVFGVASPRTPAPANYGGKHD